MSTLRETLKTSTSQAHESIEKNPRLKKLSSPDLTREEYVEILKRYYGFFRPLEEAFSQSAAGREAVGDLSERFKTPRLRHDLEALDVSAQEIALLPLCQKIPGMNDRATFLGALYVSEGSALGGRLIAKHLQQFPFINDANQTFFASDPQAVAARWKEFIEILSNEKSDEAYIERAARSANSVFTWLDDWMRG